MPEFLLQKPFLTIWRYAVRRALDCASTPTSAFSTSCDCFIRRKRISDPVLIIGASGQTGSYLLRTLFNAGKPVVGTSRNLEESNLWRLRRLGVPNTVPLLTLNPLESQEVRATLERTRPSAVVFLGGMSSVASSFERPTEATESIVVAVDNVLESLRSLGLESVFLNSASSDMFGNQPDRRLREDDAMKPVSPYGVAKLATFWKTKVYRETFGVRAHNAILTNHESPLRSPKFVTQKIVRQLREIAAGDRRGLNLGNLDITRDWLWAEDVAEAIASIIDLKTGGDFVVASGRSRPLRDLVALCAEAIGLSSNVGVDQDPSAHRQTDISTVALDPTRLFEETGWRPRVSFAQLAERLVKARV